MTTELAEVFASSVERRWIRTLMTTVLALAALNAENFESDGASSGQVLTADGAGGATFADAPSGLPDYSSKPAGAFLRLAEDKGAISPEWAEVATVPPTLDASPGNVLTIVEGPGPWDPPQMAWREPGGSGDTLPVGSVIQAASSPGAKWLEMADVEVERADYPELSAVVPTVQFNGPLTTVGTVAWNINPFPVWNGTTWCTVLYNTTKSYLSPDGVSWTEYSGSIPTARNWSSIWWVGNQWIVLCYSSRYILTSPDGITWTERDLGTSVSSRCVVNAGSKLIISAAYSNTGRQSSDGGVTWSAYTFPFSFSNDANIYKQPDVSRIWACNGNTVAYSEDEGANWTQRTNKYDTRYSGGGSALWFAYLTFRGSRVYAGCSDRLAYTDDLGVTWKGMILPSNTVQYPNLHIPSTGTEIYTSNPVAYSPDDGATWVAQPRWDCLGGTSLPFLLGIDSVGPLYRVAGSGSPGTGYFVRPYQSGATKIWLGIARPYQFGNTSWLKSYIKVLP